MGLWMFSRLAGKPGADSLEGTLFRTVFDMFPSDGMKRMVATA